jgi:hypothetical protein
MDAAANVWQNWRLVVFTGIYYLCYFELVINVWYKKSMSKPSYCAGLVKANDHDRFLQCLFVPPACREAMLALCALDCELAHVHHAVSEEMIGHIRYAWWDEGVQELYAGKQPRAHPVLQALAPVIAQPDMARLIAAYREAFPEMPPKRGIIIEQLCLQLLAAMCPQAIAGWQKAGAIIAGHRTRYGNKSNARLHLKLLWAGIT